MAVISRNYKKFIRIVEVQCKQKRKFSTRKKKYQARSVVFVIEILRVCHQSVWSNSHKNCLSLVKYWVKSRSPICLVIRWAPIILWRISSKLSVSRSKNLQKAVDLKLKQFRQVLKNWPVKSTSNLNRMGFHKTKSFWGWQKHFLTKLQRLRINS